MCEPIAARRRRSRSNLATRRGFSAAESVGTTGRFSESRRGWNRDRRRRGESERKRDGYLHGEPLFDSEHSSQIRSACRRRADTLDGGPEDAVVAEPMPCPPVSCHGGSRS